MARHDEELRRALRQVHAYAVLNHDNIVFTETGLQSFLNKGVTKPAAAEAAV